MSLEAYRADPICYLSLLNYKVNAKIGKTRANQKYVLSVLNTGAAPKLIREGCCPAEALANLDKSREIVNLSIVSKHRIDVMGLITLLVTVGGYTNRTLFAVVRKL